MSGATTYADVEFGQEFADPVDVGMETVRRYCATGHDAPRFTDHEAARKMGFPSAIVPGLMSQGVMVAAVHRWFGNCIVHKIDTVFRAVVQVDQPHDLRGVVTDMDDDAQRFELDLTLVNEAGETRVLGTASVGFRA